MRFDAATSACGFFLHPKEMSQSASWFLLVLFVALCAVVLVVITRQSKQRLGAELFEGGLEGEYSGPYTRPDPASLGIEDPDAPTLSPEMDPDSPPTAPSSLSQREVLPDPAATEYPMGVEEDDEAEAETLGGVEPFVGDEYQPF